MPAFVVFLLLPLALLPAMSASAHGKTGPAGLSGFSGKISGEIVAADGVGPIIVYLAEVPLSLRDRGEGRAEERTPQHPRLDLRERQFEPRSLIVRQGQWLEITSHDAGFHNVFSPSTGNEFDLGLMEQGQSRTVELRAPGEVEIYCDLHHEMSARILVLQNDHHLRVRPGGRYTLRDVPPGTYTVMAWSPRHEPEQRRVRVIEGTVAQADFTLRPRRRPEAHLGRRGRPL